MAFNPFSAFQKNQKFWMAAVLMICMVTFVFCTGTRGDMQDWLIRLFKGTGPTVVRVGNSKFSHFDLGRLRDERNAVNEYMRRACQATLDNINQGMQKLQEQPVVADKKEEEKRKQVMTEMTRAKLVLMERLRTPRYFEGGVKLDDLVEFKLWHAQADHLGIRLLDDEVAYLVRLELFSPGGQYISAQQLEIAWSEARRGKDMDSRQLQRAVTEEFRVRIAKLAMIEMQPGKFFAPDTGLPIPAPGMATEQRLPVSLAKLWDVYKERRSEFDVTLIPVKVSDFTKQEKGAPDDGELQKLFDKYKTSPYDPTSPLPSFQTPPEVKVEYVMADPTSPLYQGTARAKLVLDGTLPVVGAPLESPLVTATRYGAFAAGRAATSERILEGLSTKKYDIYGAADIGATHFIWPLAAHLAERQPQALASLVGNVTGVLGDPSFGGAAAWAAFLAEPTLRVPGLIDAAITAESKRRTLPSAMVAASGATGEPFAVMAAVLNSLKLTEVPIIPGMPITGAQAEGFRNFLRRDARLILPLPIIEPELEKVVENRTAEQWATRNLLAMKRLLDNNMKPEAIKRIIAEYVPKYHLKHVVTSKYYSRYDIDHAAELKPLHEAYERYFREINWFEKRDLTPERMLKEDEFYKLFFDNESFASTGKYQVRPWPPDIRPNQMQVIGMPGPGALEQPNLPPEVLMDVQRHMQHGGAQGFRLLDKAQRPILFWRHDDKAAEFPRDLAAARPLVVAAWEKEQARELKALPLAKKLADALAQNEDFSPPLLDALAVQAHQPKIVLRNISPWMPRTVGERMLGGHREYVSYQLPKDTIGYPRKDMVQDLLNLYDLKEPVQVKLGLAGGEPTFVKQVNDLNKLLYDAAKKAFPKGPQGHFVQVLTNEPMDTYYIAVVSRPPSPDAKDFKTDVLQFAGEATHRYVDTFVTRAQQQLANSFHADVVAQLKRDFNYELVDQDAHKAFDKDDAGG